MSRPRFDVTMKNLNSSHSLVKITYKFVGLTREDSMKTAKELAGAGFILHYVNGGLKDDITED